MKVCTNEQAARAARTNQRRNHRIKNCIGLILLPFAVFLMWPWFEHKQVYFPDRVVEQDGSALGHPWEDVYFKTSDGVALNGWFFPCDTNTPRSHLAILFCHGNAGNISHRFDNYEILLGLGVNVFAFDYRGYGRSRGKPSEEGTYLDAVAAHQWLSEKGVSPSNIVVYGESLGGAVAVELALRVPMGGLILQSTFASIPAIGEELFPWLPVKRVTTIQYDTLSKLPRLRKPILLMHSRSDSMIGFHHAQANFNAANEPKTLWELAGDHNDALAADPSQYREGIEQFLRGFSPTQPPGKPLAR